MGKISELNLVIKDLRSTAATINDLAETLTRMCGTTPHEEDNIATPTEIQLTLEQVRAVLAEKSRNGHTAEVRALLQKYGASKLSDIDPTHYKALVDEAEVLGGDS